MIYLETIELESKKFTEFLQQERYDDAKKVLAQVKLDKDTIQVWYRTFIIQGNQTAFQFLYDYFKGEHFNYRNFFKTASTSDQPGMLSFLLHNYSSLSKNKDDIAHAFEWAVSMNCEKSVHFFIDNHYVDLEKPGNNAVLISACEGHTQLIDYFLSCKASFDLDELLTYNHIHQDTINYLKSFKEKIQLYEDLEKSTEQTIIEKTKKKI